MLIDANGFFNINKPVGITSNVALSIFKRKTMIKKCGYAGTLDPFASGVLPIAVNKSTKLITDLMERNKEYQCVAKFGESTDTGDLTGKIIESCENIPNFSQIEDAIKNKFKGVIWQSPSIYSAIKINGKRLCDIARENKLSLSELQEIADSRAKNIEIFSFNTEALEIPYFKFIIVVSKGTYIRQLISDLALAVGSKAHLISLVRTRVGDFKIEDSISLEKLTDLFTKY